MRRLLMIGALGAGLALAACVPIKPPPPPEPPHNHLYYTEVHVAPGSVSGSYELDTACVLKDGTTSTHHDTVNHTTGSETLKAFSWPQPYPKDCTVTETAGPPMTTPSYWLTGVAPAYFGTPPTFVPITEPTTMPQTCHQTIIGTYYDPPPPLDFWECIFTVENT